MTTITLIPVLNDNYAYLIETDTVTAIVDPGEAQPVIDALEAKGKTLDLILNTHHHGDHIAGNEALVEKYGARLIGPAAEVKRIDGMDKTVAEGDRFDIGNEPVDVFETPGHTSGHIVFYLPQTKALFSGDTLFSMGCGRLFEGTPDQMWQSLQKIMSLPDDTQIYCGHEYTKANGTFCLNIEPDNGDLKQRVDDVIALREAGQPTLPVTLSKEKKTNVFLRAGSAQRFAEIRAAKDAA